VTVASWSSTPPPPASLAEFLGRYLTGARVGGRRIERAERFTAALVTAAEAGGEPPSAEDLTGEELYAVGELLATLWGQARMFPPVHPLLERVRRDWSQRVEDVPATRRDPGQPGGLRPLPTARLRPGPGPVFRLGPESLALAPDEIAARLAGCAAAGEAAAKFLRSLAEGVRRGSTEADATALDTAARAAVAALLDAGQRAAPGRSDGGSLALPQVLAAWRDWAGRQ
jgi:hypothetical protein